MTKRRRRAPTGVGDGPASMEAVAYSRGYGGLLCCCRRRRSSRGGTSCIGKPGTRLEGPLEGALPGTKESSSWRTAG